MRVIYQLSFTILSLTSAANAATITWGSATSISGPTDVSLNGTLVEAVSLGAGLHNGSTVTVNTVDFLGVGAFLNQSNNVDVNPQDIGGNVDYDTILSRVDFSNTVTATVSLGSGNLIVGQQYEIQVWFVENRLNNANLDTRQITYSDSSGSPTVTLNDEYAIGTFIADGTSQSLFIDGTLGQTSTNTNINAHLNAFQIRAIPEPSSTFLVGLSALLLINRRKRS